MRKAVVCVSICSNHSGWNGQRTAQGETNSLKKGTGKGCREGRTLSDGGQLRETERREGSPEEVASWLCLFQNNWLCIVGVTSFLSVNYWKACSPTLLLRTVLAKVWLLFRCYPGRHKFALLLKCLPPSPVFHNNLDHLRGTYLHVNIWHQIPFGQLSILPPNWKVTSANNEQQWTHFCMHLC